MRDEAPPERLLTFKSGGWVILLAAVLVLAAVAWLAWPVLTGGRAVGDREHVESYGFTLTPMTVPRATLVAANMPKDGMHPLEGFRVLTAEETDAFDGSRGGKYLVSGDWVIGVVAGGEARAYPLRVLNWHEIANDTLGGRPIAVTWSPLTYGVAVFDREIAGETLEFGVSGLLWNSNLVMYDRRADADDESLWDQILGRAVAGPAAAEGKSLAVLPCSLVTWDEWRHLHPDTTVPAPEPDLVKAYARNPYGPYYQTGKLRFPVAPLPPGTGETVPMEPVLAVFDEGRRIEIPLETAIDATRVAVDLMGDEGAARFIFRDAEDGVAVALAPDVASPPPTMFAFGFAWYAVEHAAREPLSSRAAAP